MTIKVKKRNFLKKKKIKEIKKELGEYGELLQNKKNVEILAPHYRFLPIFIPMVNLTSY